MTDYEKLLEVFEYCRGNDKAATIIPHIGPIIHAWNDLHRVDGFPRLWQQCHNELRCRAQAIAATADKERHERAKQAVLKFSCGEFHEFCTYVEDIYEYTDVSCGMTSAAEEVLFRSARYFGHTGGKWSHVVDAAVLLAVATDRPI